MSSVLCVYNTLLDASLVNHFKLGYQIGRIFKKLWQCKYNGGKTNKYKIMIFFAWFI